MSKEPEMILVEVSGTVPVKVSIRLHVPVDYDEEQILDEAEDKFGGTNSFVGNGGIDKMLGVTGTNESVCWDGDLEFSEIEKVD